MKNPLFTALAAIALGLSVPVSAEPLSVEAEEDALSPAVAGLGQDLLQLTNDMWFLLSGICDKDDAEKAAPRFRELCQKSAAISDKIHDLTDGGTDHDALRALNFMLAEPYSDLCYEFDSLCRMRCYGSFELIAEFHASVALGVFTDESLPPLRPAKPPLTAEEARAELARLRDLHKPDVELLTILQEVMDTETAAKAVPALKEKLECFLRLRPESSVLDRGFSPDSHEQVQAVYAPIEPVLWGIRSEIVRIASLPGYELEPFDDFSDALDEVFDQLGETHSIWFPEVFDESFRSDLDDALRENLSSSQ